MPKSSYFKRHFLSSSIIFTMLIVLVFVSVNYLFVNLQQSKKEAKTAVAIEIGANLLQHDFETIIGHLEFLHSSSHLNKYFTVKNKKTVQKMIEEEFVHLMQSTKFYDQIRLIDAKGREVIRVDNEGNSAIIKGDKSLQEKSPRYYFKESKRITDDKIYISPLDLNIEHGEIEKPFNPVIRFVKPIRDKKGKFKGAIVLNYFGSHFLDKFKQQMSISSGESSLVNEDGFWLSNEDTSKEWGGMFKGGETFATLYPEAWKEVSQASAGTVIDNHALFSFSSVQPIKNIEERVFNSHQFIDSWKIVVIDKLWYLSVDNILHRSSFLIPLLIIYPLGLFFIWIFSRAVADKKSAEERLKTMNKTLEQKVKERTKELEVIKNITILSMATLAETRDNETGLHLKRTQIFVGLLAKELQKNPSFSEFLSDSNVRLIRKCAPLHDIGKVGIPDHILLKRGKLTDAEFTIMKEHTVYGYRALLCSIETINADLKNINTPTFLQFALEITHFHHEKWDGSGYPTGLSGEDIPLSARIMALADVFDALTSERHYKSAFSRETTEAIIMEGSGKHFDPRIVQAFCVLKEEFWIISDQFSDRVSQYSDT